MRHTHHAQWGWRMVAMICTALMIGLIASPPGKAAPAPTKLRVGIVAAIDQLGVPVAQDQGLFEKWGLDVTIANPFASGVDLLNALQSGDIQMGQVGVPMIAAVQRGMDLVILGNYTGSSSRLGGDNTMALVARDGSGIHNIRDLKGKRVAVTFGTIAHLYILGVVAKAGLAVNDVTLVNAPGPEMPIALRGGAVDALAFWDPVPLIALRDVPKSYEVVRGGGFIGFMGFNVALRSWATQNQDTIERFLAARAEADKFIRAEPVKTAVIGVRWLPGTRPEDALHGVRNNLPNVDIRISYYNYLALYNGEVTLNRLGFLPGTFDVNKAFMPGPILNVMKRSPELFSDLPPIPREAQVGPDFQFKPPTP